MPKAEKELGLRAKGSVRAKPNAVTRGTLNAHNLRSMTLLSSKVC